MLQAQSKIFENYLLVIMNSDGSKSRPGPCLAIFQAWGSYTNHVDHFLAFFDPPSPHDIVIVIMLLIFLNESSALVVLGISLTNEDYLTFCKPLETIEV